MPIEERRYLDLALFKISRLDQFDPKQPEFPDVFDAQLQPDRLWKKMCTKTTW